MNETAKPSRAKLANDSRVMSCSCEHAWQDRRYGKGKRVHNATKKLVGMTQQYRCTVCGEMHS